MPIKVVQVGCGWMPQNGHGPALEHYNNTHPGAIELAACCDVNEQTARDYAQRFGFARWYTDFKTMLDVEQPGFVNLAVPVNLTCPMGLEVLRRRIPVLLEKPPGINIDEAQQLLEAGRGVPHRVAFNRRYVPLIVKLCEEIEKIGQPILDIHCDFLRCRRRDGDFSSTVIHGIDAVQRIAGPYSRLRFDYRELPDANPGAVPGCAHIYMQGVMQSGALVSITCSPMSGITTERYTVHCQGHSFLMSMPGNADGPEGMLVHYDHNQRTSILLNGMLTGGINDNFMAGGFYEENASMLDALIAGKPVTGGMEDHCIDPMLIADAVRARASELTL